MINWNNTQEEVKKEVIEPKEIVFKTLKEVQKNRGIKILSFGNFSSGKTHFALSSGKPLFILDTENGASPLADKFPEAKVLNISNMDSNNVEEKDEVNNFQNYMDAVDYLCNLPDEEVGTVVIDSISDIWEWAQAYGKIKVFKIGIEDRLKQQWDWGVINKLYSKPLQKLINCNCNVILTAREGEVYMGAGKPSGIFEPKCQKKTPYWVDVVLYHQIKFINRKIEFQVRIDKCRQDGNLIGKTIADPSLDKIKELLK